MTTITAPTTTPTSPTVETASATQPRQATHRVSATGVLRSEWVKLRSVRSTTMTLAATVFTLLLVGASAAAFNSGLLSTPPDGDGGGPNGGNPTSTVLSGTLLAPLIIGVLGVMLITSEYATGTIRATMTLVPKRVPVLLSKAAVLTALVLPVMVLGTLGTFLLGQALLAAGDAPTDALGDPGVLRAVLGTGAYLTGVALIGLAVGFLLRVTAAAVSVLVALVFLLPGLGGFLLPVSWQDNVLVYLPSNAATSFTAVTPGPEVLGTGTGVAVFAAWIVVPLVAAAVALKRRAV